MIRPGKSRLRYAYAHDSGCPGPPGTSPPDDAAREALAALGLSLEEVGEPVGCGASGPGMNGIAAYARVGRLLSLAARRLESRPDSSRPPAIVTPCGACARSLSRAAESLASHADLRSAVTEELAAAGVPFAPGSVRVRHLLDVLREDVGVATIREKVRRPLEGLRVAPYEGCATGEDGAGPSRLGEVLAALGAEVVDFPLRSHCCGGRAAGASEETATSLHVRLLRSAREHGAAVIATACTRCARNLSANRDAVDRRFGTRFETPAVHFASLLADALRPDAP